MEGAGEEVDFLAGESMSPGAFSDSNLDQCALVSLGCIGILRVVLSCALNCYGTIARTNAVLRHHTTPPKIKQIFFHRPLYGCFDLPVVQSAISGCGRCTGHKYE